MPSFCQHPLYIVPRAILAKETQTAWTRSSQSTSGMMSHSQGSILKVPRWLAHRRPFETSSSSGAWQGSSSCISRELTKASDQLFNSALWNSHSTTSKFSCIYQLFREIPFTWSQSDSKLTTAPIFRTTGVHKCMHHVCTCAHMRSDSCFYIQKLLNCPKGTH